MEQLEIKYRDEVRKNDGLLRMNQELMKRADFLNGFVGWLQELFSGTKHQEEHEFDEDEVQQLRTLVERERKEANTQNSQLLEQVTQLKEASKAKTLVCECARWKALYTKQTEESYRLSNLNKELMAELHSNDESTMLYRDGIKKLIDDYARVYKRLHQELVDMRIERAKQPVPHPQEEPVRERSAAKRDSTSKKDKKKKHADDAQVSQQQLQTDRLLEMQSLLVQQIQTLKQQVDHLTQQLRQSEQTTLLARRALMDYILSE